MQTDSERLTQKSTPYLLNLATKADVTTSSGYEYFGSSTRFARSVSSTAAVTALYRVGAERKRIDGSSRFVMNDVFTLAPFS